MTNRWGRCARGYTLVELLIVVTILATVAGTVSVNWRKPMRAAQFREAVSLFESTDRQTRKHAMSQLRPCRVTLDLDRNTITAQRWAAGSGYSKVVRQWPGASRVVSVKTAKETKRRGQISYSINRHGVSASLAIQLTDGEQPEWFGLVGGTGQTIEIKNIEEYVKAIQTERLNTH